MKALRIIYSIVLGITVFMFTGCSGDLLDLSPDMQNVLNNYYKDAEQLRKGVNSAYGILQAEGLYKVGNLVLGELPSDNTWDEVPANDNGNYGQLDLFSMTSANTVIDKAWSHHFKGIQQCNVILNRVDGIGDMPEAEKEKIKGEMYFLRGLMYFNLVRIFGDVQLVIQETTNPNDFFGQARTPKDEVYKQIVKDLTDAFALLPEKPAELGRATKGAAAALLGKVYLTLKDYDNSLKYLQEVEKLGYALLDEPADIFDVNNKGNKEVIFDVQFESGINGNSEGSNAFQNFSPSGYVSGSKGHNLPTNEVYGLFADSDKRKSAYFIVTKNGVIGTGKLKQTSATVADGGSNIIVLRYADVLLMLAECYAEKNDMPKANEYLNLIKERAGIDKVAISDATLMKDEIALERRKELVNEGHRWFDLVRTGKAVAVMNAYFARTPGYNGISITEQNYVQPIPQAQIDTDSATKQNEGYN
ncbi:RagB/SusD family nutrient uptake outer membrane protein [Bacteroides sp. GD17]|uniref:RagB/SusD family nutrient uptake outer membrane protein n=1 Tax=Bacteroides sp. GD17 TaxID=3139826 RepID=UPI002600D3AA|nr:RagB/SusD family nutrient uptake outer membrane protein [uncultured Bacteroides sp.]